MSQWASLREQGLLAFVYQTETTQVILLLWFHAVPLTSSKVKSLIKQLIFKIGGCLQVFYQLRHETVSLAIGEEGVEVARSFLYEFLLM